MMYLYELIEDTGSHYIIVAETMKDAIETYLETQDGEDYIDSIRCIPEDTLTEIKYNGVLVSVK